MLGTCLADLEDLDLRWCPFKQCFENLWMTAEVQARERSYTTALLVMIQS
jgi:hypothetical protein